MVSLKTIPRIKMGHYLVGVRREESARRCIAGAYSAPMERFQGALKVFLCALRDTVFCLQEVGNTIAGKKIL
jgi:hypothetical protein